MVSASDFLPDVITLSALRQAAKTCRGCHLYKNAIQTVFSEGRKNASLMIVGEIPGQKEDEEGEPFVGPSGVNQHPK
jgi:DNA polymerase